MQYTKIYIGSNNATGKLEMQVIKDTLAKYLQAYTIIVGLGYWEGKEEETAIIEIYGEYNIAIPRELKRILKQESVLVVSDYKETNFL